MVASSWPARVRQIHALFRTRSPDQLLGHRRALDQPMDATWLRTELLECRIALDGSDPPTRMTATAELGTSRAAEYQSGALVRVFSQPTYLLRAILGRCWTRDQHQEIALDPLTWTASSIAQALIGQLIEPPPPGAGLADRPIHLSAWVTWREGGKREVRAGGVKKIVKEVTRRVVHGEPKYRNVSNETVELVTHQVTETLMSLDAITMDHVQAANLDPARLAEALQTASSLRDPYSDSLGRSLHSKILNECCIYLVEYFTHRPEFLARTAVEQSQALGKLLDRTVDTRAPYQDYELRYKQGLVALNGKMQVFGLGLPVAQQSYQLSTAYVSLSLQRANASGDHSREDPTQANENVSFEEMLGGHSRILLEGPAGAGKTTLLMRLALHICRGDLPPQLASWRGSVPFLLRLRNFVSEGVLTLPQPDQFPTATIPPIVQEPNGWTASLLDAGKAVVLIDGIDEVPESFRPLIMDWLDKIISFYPAAHYLVTSRPAALDAHQRNLLERLEFTPARLEPMTPTQVDEFIDRWHEAALETAPADGPFIADRARELKNSLLRRRNLSRLATNPLMCAMLCALNRNHNSNLPPGRIALYRAAFTMLLGRRDQEKRIPSGLMQLTEDQAQALLAHMAMKMTQNGRRTMLTADAELYIEDVLPRVHSRGTPESSITSKAVLRYLLERTGVLQEPIIDHLEFRHPSFQDYLAAIEMLRGRALGHLLRNAHDPLYHDVIIMAVGLSQNDPTGQREILGGLLERARGATLDLLETSVPPADAVSQSRSLWLLAAACIADVEMVDPDLVRLIQAQTKELLPPEDINEAERIARAGEFVVDLLAEVAVRDDLSIQETIATARVASLIGGDASLMILKHLRAHRSPYVQAQILDGWFRSRPAERFADEVLADAALDQVDVKITDKKFIGLLPRLSRLRHLRIACSVEESELTPLAELTGLISLDLSDVPITDVALLAALSHLEYLILNGTQIHNLTAISTLSRLKALHLSGTPIRDLSPIARLALLEELDLSTTPVTEITPLAELENLEVLNLSGTRPPNLSALRSHRRLGSLDLSDTEVSRLDFVDRRSPLKTLKLARTRFTDLSDLEHLTSLRGLDLYGTRVFDLRPLWNLSNLVWLDIGETRVSSINALYNLTQLQSLDLLYCRVENLEVLENLTNLRSLNLRGTGVTDLTPLAGLTNLRTLNLRGTPVANIEPLRSLPHLQKLDLMGTAVSDISPLRDLSELQSLDIFATPIRDVTSLRARKDLHIDAAFPFEK